MGIVEQRHQQLADLGVARGQPGQQQRRAPADARIEVRGEDLGDRHERRRIGEALGAVPQQAQRLGDEEGRVVVVEDGQERGLGHALLAPGRASSTSIAS
ncbi:MAG: hypothetical protein R3F59_08905 [Myxococcota bacterium]